MAYLTEQWNKSLHCFGERPQILVSIYAKNRWSVETTLGYCWGHLPIIGSDVAKTTQPIRIPKDSTIMGELSNWITSRNAELKNPKVLLDSYENKELISMEKNGELKLNLRTLCRGTNEDCSEPYGKDHHKLTKRL
ncbi:B9 domain-containing protein 1 [Episyrphus balteatus]|uniref:B9 domain-containing protein 1 n=1 Tax=Episyrphus balteatus TaxID=286459 RepID=UPI0024850265|nr:B9 domain-containing protein 1 [Episyrphus balteatus]